MNRKEYKKEYHNHQTEVIRGLLCHHCNTALGMFKEIVVY